MLLLGLGLQRRSGHRRGARHEGRLGTTHSLGEEHHGTEARDEQDHPGGQGRTVESQGSLTGNDPGALGDRGQRRSDGHGEGGYRQDDLGRTATGARHEGLHQHCQAGASHQSEDRHQRSVLDVRGHDVKGRETPERGNQQDGIHLRPSLTTGAGSVA